MQQKAKTGILIRFLAGFVVASVFIPLQPVSAQRLDSAGTHCLKLLSWNIYMLPHLWMHTGQRQRAVEIAEALANESADMVVLEEAFDKKSREILWDRIKTIYPYHSGAPSKNHSLKINSGVWIVSRIPLKMVRQIFFTQSMGADRLACKGAILVEAEKDGTIFQLVGTHLQSAIPEKDVRNVQLSQYRQIREYLLEACRKPGVPQFVAGDFNTVKEDTLRFQLMLDVLKVKECPLQGNQCYSYDYSANDFLRHESTKPQLLDYVLFHNDNRNISGFSRVKIIRKKWSDKHADLSDHFAISTLLSFN